MYIVHGCKDRGDRGVGGVGCVGTCLRAFRSLTGVFSSTTATLVSGFLLATQRIQCSDSCDVLSNQWIQLGRVHSVAVWAVLLNHTKSP